MPSTRRQGWETMVRIQLRIAKKSYLNSKRVYSYQRVGLPIPKKFHKAINPTRLRCRRFLLQQTMQQCLQTCLMVQPVTIIWGPQGSTTGNPKVTLTNVVLTAYSVKNGQKGTIANDISGEAQSVASGTF